MITADQIRAARALANWSQGELSKRTGLSTPAIGNIEIEKHKPSLETQTKIIQAFSEADIEFIDEGVRRMQDKVKILEGDDAFLRLLDDIFYSVSNSDNKEVLVSCADERQSSDIAIAKITQTRKAGAKFRHLIEDGNNFIMGPLNEYKFIPEKFFINRVSVVYAGKVAFVSKDLDTGYITVIKDTSLVSVQRNFFEFFWSHSVHPTFSNAEKRYS